jgi:hypothetical protein
VSITLDAYGTFNDQLLLSHVDMIRKKLIAKDDNLKIQNLKENSATDNLIKRFNRSGTRN